jgi:N6-adenosine-specific RNA methylase IME4
MANEISLVRYEAARQALAEAQRIDEVKDIRDKMVALSAYARQAKDAELIGYATEIRMRAERRLGQMLVDQKASIGLNKGAAGSRVIGSKREPVMDDRPKLASVGIDKKLSSRAQRTAAVPDKDFEERLLDLKASVISAAESTAEERRIAKMERRIEREAELGATLQALPNKHFGVVYADPEWRFEVWSRETGLDRAADNHYPTSATNIIASRDVATIAANDCVLFLWATAPMLPQAIEVMKAWGFEYKTHFVWVKDRIGTGYWNRNKHELLLVGTTGDVPAPAMGTQFPSAIEAPVGRHSEKPDFAYEIIESYFPNLPKIELNARQRRPGWDTWGLEAPADATP